MINLFFSFFIWCIITNRIEGDIVIGNVIAVEKNEVYIKLNEEALREASLVHRYVSMLQGNKDITGEIINIKDGIADVNLVGEFIDGKFVFGVLSKPSTSASVSLIPQEKVADIISVSEFKEEKHLLIGKSAIYDGVDVCVDINDFFSGHFAIFGSTGSGKSSGISRIFQNLFMKKNPIPYRASFFIFDAYGEYHSAFEHLNEIVPEISFKSYTTNVHAQTGELLRIPLWLLGVDDIALLLGAEKHSQIQIIEKALKLTTVFAQDESKVIKSKNDIIASALLDILSSGKSSTSIRDQVISVLAKYNTSELNLDSLIEQPGYTRTFKQCLNIDATGKLRDIELVTQFVSKFLTDDYTLVLPDGSFKYTLDDLKDAFDFALIAEGVLNSERIFDEANILKVRIHALASGDESVYFNYPDYISKEQYIRSLLTLKDGRKCQIINFNINYIDDRLAKNITKIYSKLLFDYAKELDSRGTLPFHIILEEAHRYVQNDNDKFLLGYNIFERITKEGRKYGVILGLISQRPSELSETALSQCVNFLIFKMLHPLDIGFIEKIVPNITTETVEKLKILQPGSCIAFGAAFKVPVLVKLQMPNPAPSSSSCDMEATWFVRKNQ